MKNNKNYKQEIIDKMEKKINSLLNAFKWTNDYVKGRNDVLNELLDYLHEIEKE